MGSERTDTCRWNSGRTLEGLGKHDALTLAVDDAVSDVDGVTESVTVGDGVKVAVTVAVVDTDGVNELVGDTVLEYVDEVVVVGVNVVVTVTVTETDVVTVVDVEYDGDVDVVTVVVGVNVGVFVVDVVNEGLPHYVQRHNTSRLCVGALTRAK